MDIRRNIEREKEHRIAQILFPFVLILCTGYILYLLILGDLFVGWEIYFVLCCYAMIFISLTIIDAKIIWTIRYRICISGDRLRITDGFLTRTLVIPIDRLYYISTDKASSGGYCTVFIIDKRINHSSIRPLSEERFKNFKGHLSIIRELEDRYLGKKFYYYRVYHSGYKFKYYLYMLYKNCDRCKFSGESMELIKQIC